MVHFYMYKNFIDQRFLVFTVDPPPRYPKRVALTAPHNVFFRRIGGNQALREPWLGILMYSITILSDSNKNP